MIFKSLAAACAAGIRFALDISAADDGKLCVNVHPTTDTGKSGFNLTPVRFVATAEELDAEFGEILQQYGSKQMTLAEQLKAAVQVADQTALEAAEKAVAKPATTAKTPGRSVTPSKSAPASGKPKSPNAVPAGMFEPDSDENDHGDDDDATGGESSAHPSTSVEPVAGAVEPETPFLL